MTAAARETAAGSPETRRVSLRAERWTSSSSRRSLRLRSAWPRKASWSMEGSMARLRFKLLPLFFWEPFDRDRSAGLHSDIDSITFQQFHSDQRVGLRFINFDGDATLV